MPTASSGCATRNPVPRWSRAVERLVVAFLALFVLWLLAHLLSYGYGRDQGIYAVVGHTVAEGGLPYRDAWDFKPPGIHFLFALARGLFGPSTVAIRILEALALLSLLPAFRILSRRFVGSPGAAVPGLVLAVLFQVGLEFWHSGQPELFGGVLIAWALVLATASVPGDPPRPHPHAHLLWAATGTLYATAAFFKPPLGGGFLVTLAYVLILLRRGGGDARSLTRAVGWFALGGALPVAILVAVFALGDAGEALRFTFLEFLPHYTGLGTVEDSLPSRLTRATQECLFGFHGFLPVGLLLWLLLPRRSADETFGALHVLGVAGIQLFGVALQAKFFTYHYSGAMPLVSLVAGWGWWRLWCRVRACPAGLVLLIPLVLFLVDARTKGTREQRSFWSRCGLRHQAWLHPEQRTDLRDQLNSATVNARANRLVAEMVRANTKPGDSVYVWGFEPIVYELADRRPASRYIYNVPQRVDWVGERLRRELLEDLERDPPAAILVEHGDVLPNVTGRDTDSAADLQQFPGLRDLIRSRYRRVGQTGHLEVFERRNRRD